MAKTSKRSPCMRTEETCRTGEDNGHSFPCTGHVWPCQVCATQMPSPGAMVSQFKSQSFTPFSCQMVHCGTWRLRTEKARLPRHHAIRWALTLQSQPQAYLGIPEVLWVLLGHHPYVPGPQRGMQLCRIVAKGTYFQILARTRGI